MTAGVDGTGPPQRGATSPTGSPADADHPAGTSPADGGFEAAEALPRVLRIVGSVVAPTTLLTGLLFYFGLLYAVAYYRYFGVNHTVLRLSAQDLLVLSADAAIPPLTFLAVATLLALWLLRLPLHRLSSRTQRIGARWLAPVLGAAGAVLAGLALGDAYLGIAVFPAGFLEARGLSLSIGVLVMAYAGRLRRIAGPARRPRAGGPDALVVAKWTSVFVLVAVGLFWAVGSYAIGTGRGNAQGFTAGLACAPEVVVYSEKSLDLRTAGVREESFSVPGAAYAYRYPGLRLVPQAGDQYLLLPADWASGDRPALLLPKSGAVRLEFLLHRC
jgi:hypothetical protein